MTASPARPGLLSAGPRGRPPARNCSARSAPSRPAPRRTAAPSPRPSGCPRRPRPSTPACSSSPRRRTPRSTSAPAACSAGRDWTGWPGSGGRSACTRRRTRITSARCSCCTQNSATPKRKHEREATRGRLRHAREALLFEHLWSWAPGYLTAVTRLGVPSLAAWAQLTRSALGREARWAAPPAALPLALRTAPAPVSSADGREPAARRAGRAGALRRPAHRRGPARRGRGGGPWVPRRRAALHAAGDARPGRQPRRWAGWAATPASRRPCTPPSSASAGTIPGTGGRSAPHAPPAPWSGCEPGLSRVAKWLAP